MAEINREVQQLVPRLVVSGRETMLNADDASVQVRMRTEKSRNSGLIIAINTSPRPVETAIHLASAGNKLCAPFEGREAQSTAMGDLRERFTAYGVHVYVWGPEPSIKLAREQQR